MPTFIHRTYIEPTATLPMEVTLPKGRLLGITDGGGALPSLRVWQEVVKAHPASEPADWDRWHVWVLRHGQRAPEHPVARPWDLCEVVQFNHQPAVLYALNLGPAAPVKSTAEVLAELDDDNGSTSWQRYPVAGEPR